MVRDGVDAISGSFESPRWLHTVSHSGAVVSDSTPLRSRALRLLRLRRRARPAFRVFRYRGAPSGRGRARPATKLMHYVHAGGVIGYVITYRQFTRTSYFI